MLTGMKGVKDTDQPNLQDLRHEDAKMLALFDSPPVVARLCFEPRRMS